VEIGGVDVGERPQNANFVSYIEKCIHSFEQGSISTDMMVENLSAATVIQYMLMFLAGDVVRESARSINDYSTCLAIKKMMSFICLSSFRGTIPTCYLPFTVRLNKESTRSLVIALGASILIRPHPPIHLSH
jgi:hypothetical protein